MIKLKQMARRQNVQNQGMVRMFAKARGSGFKGRGLLMSEGEFMFKKTQ